MGRARYSKVLHDGLEVLYFDSQCLPLVNRSSQIPPRNLTFNKINATLTWQGVPEQDAQIYYRCTARSNGREEVIDVTSGLTMVTW